MMPPAVCGGYWSSPSSSARDSAESLGNTRRRSTWPMSPHDLGALVGGQLFQEGRRPAGIELLDDLAAPAQGRLVQDAHRARDGQHRDDGRALLQRQLVDQVGHVHVGQLGHVCTDADEAVFQAQPDPFEQFVWDHGDSLPPGRPPGRRRRALLVARQETGRLARRASQRQRRSSSRAWKRGSARRLSSLRLSANKG